jgi:hypothetical protein
VRRTTLPQQQRLLAAGVYGVGLLLLAKYLNGSILPPFGVTGLWFYSAAATIILGDLLLEPYFTRPADTLSSSIAVVIAAGTTTFDPAIAASPNTFSVGRWTLLGLGLAGIAVASLAILLRARSGRPQAVSQIAMRLCMTLGRSRWAFGALLAVTGYLSFADSSSKVAVLLLAWFLVTAFRPVEALLEAFPALQTIPKPSYGRVITTYEPLTVVASWNETKQSNVPVRGQRVALDGGHGTIAHVSELSSTVTATISLDEAFPVTFDTAVKVDESDPDESVVGTVTTGTILDEVRIIAAAEISTTEIEEGHLLSVPIRDREALYQVVGAQLVRRGADAPVEGDHVEIRARKLGAWKEESSSFDPIPWLPTPGCLARIVLPSPEVGVSDNTLDGPVPIDWIGTIPGTSFRIRYDTALGVTHNTAILGILGIGKTRLAWEIIRRTVSDGCKVVILDITDQYAPAFRDLFDEASDTEVRRLLERDLDQSERSRRLRDGDGEAGSVETFRNNVREVIRRFVESDASLLVINPNRVRVTKADGGFPDRDGNTRTLIDLNMVEVTRVFAEEILKHLQETQDLTTEHSARVSLVLEEAHSLVPEWNSVANDSEKTATMGTARAILQGRKYGFGCLLITQRTANVTKSILNQCNTIFSLRNFDATGAGFLENYVGASYTSLIATLKDRHAILVGRASSCNAPIVVALNDSDDFRDLYWRYQAPRVSASRPEMFADPEPLEGEPTLGEPRLDDDADAIPF